MEHLVLIDGHHLLYRAYWAIPRTLKTRAGEQVNVTFGVASMLLHILRIEQPDALLFCFDAGEETFRHQEHTEYKEGRAETPDDFYPQIDRAIQCVEAFGLRHVADKGFEADDLIGSYATAGRNAGMRVTIVSGDRDVLQLVNGGVRVAIPHKGYQEAQYLDAAEVEKKYGIRPDQVVDYKGLTGDSSDNLPGVKGIGPKTASELLKTYGTLDGVYEHLADIRPAVRAKLEADKDQAFFCRRMARIVCDMQLAVPVADLCVASLSLDRIDAFFREMEFTLLQRRVRELAASEYGKQIFDGSTVPAMPITETSVATEEKKSQLSLF